MILGVIPARGGSKRIPRKNVKPFCGKPMIAWSIEAALATDIFDAIIVSTDDDEIAAVAERHGAEAPFRRPAYLSGDKATTLPVIAHAIEWFENQRSLVDMVCCLYPTAPLLRPEYLHQGFQRLRANPQVDFAFSVTSYAFPIFRALKLDADGTVGMFWPENEQKRSQDLPEAYHDAGQFYWGRKDAFLKQAGIFTARSIPVVLPRRLVQDIDTPEDWDVAELLFNLQRHTQIEGGATAAHT